MPSAQHQVTIARPVGEVFAYVADGLNGPRWRPGVLDISLVSGTGAGAVYIQGVKGPGGRRIDADYRITANAPPPPVLRRDRLPGRPTGTYLFEDEFGGTRLTFSLEADLGGIKKLADGRGGAEDHGCRGRRDRETEVDPGVEPFRRAGEAWGRRAPVCTHLRPRAASPVPRGCRPNCVLPRRPESIGGAPASAPPDVRARLKRSRAWGSTSGSSPCAEGRTRSGSRGLELHSGACPSRRSRRGC